MKRAFDLAVAFLLLLLLAPLLAAIAIAIWAYDGCSPFYRARRVGKDGAGFVMLKFRSMRVDADKSGVSSTAANDPRITPVGAFVRRFKLDELTQLYNVLVGDMSLVGPRPNVEAGTAVYTAAERCLLSVRPGITDFASIVFADEGEILRDQADPDAAYDGLIRPWKSRLGLLYVDHAGFALDLRILALTALALISRRSALEGVAATVAALGAPPNLVAVCLRQARLVPSAPPGAEAAPVPLLEKSS